MDAFVQDMQFALRTLRRAPGFAAVVVISLALGIGANTLVYSALDGLVLHPFAFPDADRLVAVGVTYPKISGERSFIETLSPPEYVDIRNGTPSLERVSAYDLGNRSISGGDHPERVFTAFVWGDPLSTIGLPPFLGRSFRAEETATPGTALAVLSHRIWQARFASDSGIVGRSIRVNGRPVTVIGVLPPDALLLGTDLWLPMAVNPMDVPRRARQYAILARLRDGAMLADANRDLAQVAQRTDRDHRTEYAAYEGWRLDAAPWAEAVTSNTGLRQAAFVLQGAVLLVLLIACANVAGLLLSRGATRAPEIAMRRALGARGGRLVRQLLTEGMLLSLMGGAAGFAIAAVFMGPLTRALPDMLQGMGVAARPNVNVLLFTLASAVAVGLVFGLTPVLQVARGRLDAVFGGAGARSTTGRHTTRLRSGVLTLQVALSVVLLVAAGLLVRSFGELRRVELGFSPSQVLTMRLSLPREKYPRDRLVPAMEELETRVQAIAGVRGVAASTQYPPGNAFSAPVSHPGETPRESEGRVADVTNATPGFFATLGYRLQLGRLFTAADDERAPRVALLNETAAKRFFSGRAAVGERLFLGDTANGVEVQVVGVTADVRNRGLDAPVAPEIFIPARQQQVAWNNQFFLLVRTTGVPMRALPAIREQLKAMDPDQPVYSISTVERELGDALLKRRAAMAFLLVFAAISLTLACVGIYGLVTYAVNERVREIGIRMALGAVAADVRRLVLRQVLIIVGIGAFTGLLLSVAAAGSMRALVFGVSPTDPVTLGMVAILLPLVAIAAAALPARRATRIDPVEALREG
jgi:putative ABC transport system permease protein